MPGIKELKTRIKSIQSTRKITRAMQMVEAAKMRKSQQKVVESRTYAALAWELISSLRGSLPEEVLPELMRVYTDARKIGIVLITTNRGLVGSLNTNLINSANSLIKQSQANELVAEIITYGKKGNQVMSKLSQSVIADFLKEEKALRAEDVYPLARHISSLYTTGQYQAIYIVYNHFVSTLSQKATVKQLLPFADDNQKLTWGKQQSLKSHISNLEPIFEPSPLQVLNHLLPRIIESQLYETILEGNASENSARMVMMKNATEAAGDLISDYTLTYNQLRQGKITTELAEITAGKIALE